MYIHVYLYMYIYTDIYCACTSLYIIYTHIYIICMDMFVACVSTNSSYKNIMTICNSFPTIDHLDDRYNSRSLETYRNNQPLIPMGRISSHPSPIQDERVH